MTKRKKTTSRKPSRLARIERKCDRILSELLIIRQRLSHSRTDSTLDRLHSAAVKMRIMCEQERDAIRRLYPDLSAAL